MKLIRTVSLLALASAALSAHAVVAFSNLGPYGDFRFDTGALVGPWFGAAITSGFDFTTTERGVLTGFQVAMNHYYSLVPQGYTLQLYADGGDKLGSLLGTYSGMSTGVEYDATRTALSSVFATDSAPVLERNTKYWLVASSPSGPNTLTWNGSFDLDGTHYYSSVYGSGYEPFTRGAFRVFVTPGPMAALPFALMAIKRRKRA